MKNCNASVNGPAAAAILGSGLGCMALGLITTSAESIPALKNALTFSVPVGALSGQTTAAVIIWLLGWAVLHSKWKHTQTDLGKVFAAALALVLLGTLGTLPPVWEIFH